MREVLVSGVFILACLMVSSVSAISYSEYLDGLKSPVIDSINGTHLWVPWFSKDSSCGVSDLKSGSSCNSGQSIDFQHNCMVSDEFSQVGILYANDPKRPFDRWVNTVKAMVSDKGQLPAWRVYRDGDKIQACRAGINGNCDTASDATARIIIALYEGAATFNNGDYVSLAGVLAADHVQYEAVHSCMNTSQGQICYWLAAGADAASGGRSSVDFGYTGYFPDAIEAMQLACKVTGNQTFCDVADDYQRQYLLAANWDGVHFTVPPGRSWRWSGTTAICTNTCSPVRWDMADAPRALAMCGLQGLTSEMKGYCAVWFSKYMTNPTSTMISYTPQGQPGAQPQNGYFSQGLAAQFYAGWKPDEQAVALASAFSHYRNGRWGSESCFGVYGKAFALRELGEIENNNTYGVNEMNLTNASVLVAMLAVLASMNVSADGNLTVNITVQDNAVMSVINTTGNVSEDVLIPVNLTTNLQRVAGVQFDMTLPSDVVFINVSAGAAAVAAGKDMVLNVYNSTTNIVTVVIFGLNVNEIADGEVAVVQVHIASNATGGVRPVMLDGVLLADPDALSVPVRAENGTLTVVRPVTPIAVSNVNCPSLTYPNGADLPTSAVIPVTFSVFSENFPVVNVSSWLTGPRLVNASLCVVVGSGQTRNYTCNMTMRYFYGFGTYTAHVSASDAMGSDVKTVVSCQYGKLLSAVQSGNGLSFSVHPGTSNQNIGTVNVYNYGNVPLRVSVVALDLFSASSVVLAANNFKAGESLGGSVTLQNNTDVFVTTLNPGENAISSIIFWLSVPSSQPLASYASSMWKMVETESP